MSDAFTKRLMRAVARNKSKEQQCVIDQEPQTTDSPSNIKESKRSNDASFNVELYRATVITKTIEFIHNRKGKTNDRN